MITFGIELAAQATIERTTASGEAGGNTFPLDPVNGQPYLLTEDIEGFTRGLYVWSAVRSLWIPQLSDYYAYDVGLSILKRFKPLDIIARYLSVRTTSIRPNFEGSMAICNTPPDSQIVFSVFVEDGKTKQRTNIATVTFGAGQTTGTFNSIVPNTEYVLVAGDVLCIESPDVMEYSMRGTSITICGAMIM